jgi:putative addiction module component (TIGR02574 family)
MASDALLARALELSPAERILLVEDIWDSLSEDGGALPLTDAQRSHLDERLAAHDNDPEAGSSWDEVRARILKRS